MYPRMLLSFSAKSKRCVLCRTRDDNMTRREDTYGTPGEGTVRAACAIVKFKNLVSGSGRTSNHNSRIDALVRLPLLRGGKRGRPPAIRAAFVIFTTCEGEGARALSSSPGPLAVRRPRRSACWCCWATDTRGLIARGSRGTTVLANAEPKRIKGKTDLKIILSVLEISTRTSGQSATVR